MNVLVNTSTRFFSTPDGRFWAPSENLSYSYWTRFLDVFEEVRVLGRAFAVTEPPSGAKAVTGPGVTVIPLPNYSGLPEFVRQYFTLRRLIRESVRQSEALYLSLPCALGDLVWRSLPASRPFGVGVCGDPYDVLAPGASNHPLRPWLRWQFSRRLRLACQKACACTYVTRSTLQRRYPCRDGSFSTYYSSIHLTPEAIAEAPLTAVKEQGEFQLLNVGTFDTWYKGPDILLRAVANLMKRGREIRLTFVGDGRHRPAAEEMADELGIRSHVRFLGQLSFSAAVRAELDAADLFVFPSRTEGLPKALVEAMARGLPCVATAVGGIPELLSAEDLVPSEDPDALADRIEVILAEPKRRESMSQRNLTTAREYSSQVLRGRRVVFYEALRSRTAEWLASRAENSRRV